MIPITEGVDQSSDRLRIVHGQGISSMRRASASRTNVSSSNW
jgi:hypothetical protein